jgi:hypothetical protein
MGYCERCGYEYRAGVPACPDCGEALVAGRRVVCPKCREEIAEDEASCPHCGVLLPAGDVPVPSCETHDGVPAVARCVLCEVPLCELCVERRGGKAFCVVHADEKTAFDWVSVRCASSPLEAQFTRAALEAAGIPVTLLSQADSMYVVTVGDLAVTEVMVPNRALGEARDILRSLDEGSAEGDAAGSGPEPSS